MSAQATRRRRPLAPKNYIARGTVQSFILANGQWLAVVTSFRSTPGAPVLSQLVPVAELKGSARRKADRWVESLS